VVEQFTENEGLASELTYGVGRSPAGEVLVATYGGLGRLTSRGWYFDQDEPLDASTRAIVVRGQTLWAATSRGVVRKGPDGVRVFNEAMGLAGNMVTDLYFEGDRRIWVLTNQGLSVGKLPLK
jgi:ligand-binding sensor domain-containing protein